MNETTPRLVAAKALSLLDLTDLTDKCDAVAIERLCQQAITPFGHVAAICIWPRFVAQARTLLGLNSPVKIATVVNFPSGDLPVDAVIAETRQAIADGADEIDLVIPYKALMAGNEGSDELRQQLIKHVRTEIGPIASPDKIQFAPGLPKTRSGKIMRRILRKIAEDDFGSLGDTSTLADPAVVDDLIANRQNKASA